MRPRCASVSVCLRLAGAMIVVHHHPAGAHHSFAMFDSVNKTTITGTVTRFEWTNPHVLIEMDVPGQTGAVTHWSVELGSPSILQRSGWKFSDVKPGAKVTAIGNPLTWGFYEEIAPGAFSRTISGGDARMLVDHDSRMVVARVAAGS